MKLGGTAEVYFTPVLSNDRIGVFCCNSPASEIAKRFRMPSMYTVEQARLQSTVYIEWRKETFMISFAGRKNNEKNRRFFEVALNFEALRWL